MYSHTPSGDKSPKPFHDRSKDVIFEFLSMPVANASAPDVTGVMSHMSLITLLIQSHHIDESGKPVATAAALVVT